MNSTYQHRPRKRFGQNFLHDPAVIERICNEITPPLPRVTPLLEIGPGLGALSYALASYGHPVYAIELDRDLVQHWRETQTNSMITIIEQDALKLNLPELIAEHNLPVPLTVVGNLPYNIATALITRLLDQREHINRMVFMVQKEVGLRLTAQPGDSEFSRLSVLVSNLAKARYAFTVAPGAFSPPPKVESAIIELTVREQPLVDNARHELFEQLVTMAFKQRRKTLRNNLKPLLSTGLIEQAGIDPSRRPQTLSVAEYDQLTALLAEKP